MNKNSECPSLPVTRKGLFFDILRNRFGLLLKTGLVLCLFLLPMVAVSLVSDQMFLSFSQDSSNFSGNDLSDKGMALYTNIELIKMAGVSLSALAFAVGLSGVMRIYRQMCWSEGVLFWPCFKEGVKQNAGTYIACGVIFDIIYMTYKLVSLFSTHVFVIVFVLAAALLLFLPVIIADLFYSSIYKGSFFRQIKNSAVLALKNYPFAMLITVLSFGFICLSLIPCWMTLIKQAIYLAVSLLIAPIFFVLSFNVFNYIFDKDINTSSHKDMVRKGLY